MIKNRISFTLKNECGNVLFSRCNRIISEKTKRAKTNASSYPPIHEHLPSGILHKMPRLNCP